MEARRSARPAAAQWSLITLLLCGQPAACADNDGLAPDTPGGEPTGADPLDCTLGPACSDLGVALEGNAEQGPACDDLGDAGTALWQEAFGLVECPVGLCAERYPMVVATDDSLVAAGYVHVPGAELHRISGFHLARYSPEGERLAAELWNFAIRPFGVGRKVPVGLHAGDRGAVLLTGGADSRLPPSQHVQVYELARVGPPYPVPQGVLAAKEADSVTRLASGDWLASARVSAVDGAARGGIGRFTSNGVRVWNRPWPASDRPPNATPDAGSELDYMHIYLPPHAAQDDSAAVMVQTSEASTLARLDAQGQVLFRRELAARHSPGAEHAIDAAGNVLILLRDADTMEIQVERISADGTQLRRWRISEADPMGQRSDTVQLSRVRGEVALVNAAERTEGGWNVTLYIWGAAGNCRMRSHTIAAGQPFDPHMRLAAGPEDALYYSHALGFGRLPDMEMSP